MHNTEPVLEKDSHKLLGDFDIQKDHLISARWLDHAKKKKERSCRIVDFAVPADNRMKLKESGKKGKYLDLPRELKVPWNMKVTFIPIVFGAHGTVTEGLVHRLEDLEITGRVDTLQTTSLLRSVKILRRVLGSLGDLLSLKFPRKTAS